MEAAIDHRAHTEEVPAPNGWYVHQYRGSSKWSSLSRGNKSISERASKAVGFEKVGAPNGVPLYQILRREASLGSASRRVARQRTDQIPTLGSATLRLALLGTDYKQTLCIATLGPAAHRFAAHCTVHMLSWWNGRHASLRGWSANHGCRFESGREHHRSPQGSASRRAGRFASHRTVDK
jgi:hypothetical protein